MATVRCESCGHDNPPEARFCANCGSNLAAATGQPAPTVVPTAGPATPEVAAEYVGFWVRFGAALLDGIIITSISFVFPRIIGLGMVSPFLAILVAWLYYWLFTGLKGQTLGKMAAGIKVVNTEGSVPRLAVAALREVPGKLVSSLALCLGFLWIIRDERKQGWHDRMANTYVVKVASRR